jgi:hypothetical protein
MGAILTGKLHGLTPGRPGYATDFVSAWQTMAVVAAIISFASAAIAFFGVRKHREFVAAETSALAPGGER